MRPCLLVAVLATTASLEAHSTVMQSLPGENNCILGRCGHEDVQGVPGGEFDVLHASATLRNGTLRVALGGDCPTTFSLVPLKPGSLTVQVDTPQAGAAMKAMSRAVDWLKLELGVDRPVSLATQGLPLLPLAIEAFLQGVAVVTAVMHSGHKQARLVMGAVTAVAPPGLPGRPVVAFAPSAAPDLWITTTLSHTPLADVPVRSAVVLLGEDRDRLAAHAAACPRFAALLPSESPLQAFLCAHQEGGQTGAAPHVSTVARRGKVVVKTVPVQYATMGAWHREVWWLQRLASSGVVPRLVRAEEGTRSIVTQWAGEPVTVATLPPDWLAQGHALQELLEREGCKHNDWHPGNVVVSPKGKLVLLDFSWATWYGDWTCGGLCPGTQARPHGASPYPSLLSALEAVARGASVTS